MAFELIFRPNDGYFLTTPTGFHWSANLPDQVSSRLLKTRKDEPELEKLYHLSLGPDGNYFMSWKDSTGASWTDHTAAASYPEFASWLKENPSYEANNYKIFLGSNGQFFARGVEGETQALQWCKLPAKMVEAILEMKDGNSWKAGQTPSNVSLGVEDSFVILCNGGRNVKWSDNIAKTYPTFHKEVLEKFAKGCTYEFLAINPHTKDQHFAVWDDSSCGWRVPTAFASLLLEEATKFASLASPRSRREAENMESDVRDTALLNQATRLATEQMRRSARTLDSMGCIGTGYHYEYFDASGRRVYDV